MEELQTEVLVILDEKDKEIIKFFQKHPRTSFTKAAKALGMAKGTVQRRYEDLIERNLISVGIGLNLSQLKFSHALSFIEITDPQTEKAILDYFHDCPLVTAIFSLSGFEYNLVICLVADTREKIATFIDTFPLSHLPGVKRRNSFFVKESEGFSDKPFWYFFPNGSNKDVFKQYNCQNKCGVCGVMERITEEVTQ
ncbi:MAG: Lrp/AsnC family transcriptional regulator [Candidatus Thorarchaeota archaeon]